LARAILRDGFCVKCKLKNIAGGFSFVDALLVMKPEVGPQTKNDAIL